MKKIKLTNIDLEFEEVEIFSSFELEIVVGKITTLIGPSGCGKTSFLNLLSNVIDPQAGKIYIPDNLRIGYLQQENHLLKWRTLSENIHLGIELVEKKKNNLVHYYIEKFGLDGFENHFPEELSGGMRQRACLIRTLAINPDILLIDEGFSNLDFDIKMRIQREVLKYQKKNNVTIVMVTHDIEDSIALSDEVVVLSEKPASIKKIFEINLELEKKDPVEARKKDKFRDYFTQIVEELKYLDQ